jgi:hypothetical protein
MRQTSQTESHVLRSAVLAAAPVIRGGVLHGMGREAGKVDGSEATATDHKSQDQMLQILSSLGLPVVAEEAGVGHLHVPTGVTVFGDPLDGTAAGRAGACTSTAGAFLYDPAAMQFGPAAVIDPFGGRLWYNDQGHTWVQFLDPTSFKPVGEALPCRASNRELQGGVVAIEISHGFVRTDVFTGERRPVLDQRSATELHYWLQAPATEGGLGAKVGGWSSNLLHQALVADGMQGTSNRSVVATVMTAIGGFWDMGGVALVLAAGGAVVFLRIENGQLKQTANPLLADMVVCANTMPTATAVVGVLRAVVQRQTARSR